MPPTKVMGIVNVTPDSFSDGGEHLDRDAAIAHGRKLVDEGAQILDIGGESTRPGIVRTEPAEELRRVLPVVRGLAGVGVPLSVDTMRAEVARTTIEAGASIINDVSGGLADPDMLSVAADLGVPYVVMHWRSHSTTMNDLAQYGDIVAEVAHELRGRVDAALAAGVSEANIIVDPGLGFAKSSEHNWALLRHLQVFERWGFPLLIGASRKRFLGQLLATTDAEGTRRARPPAERDHASAALTTLLATPGLLTGNGVWAVRTHAVPEHRDAIAVATALAETD